MKPSPLCHASRELSIIFAGTPDFAATALTYLLKEKFRVVAVYTQPDRPAGRGQNLNYSAVKKLALKEKLPIYQPDNFKNPEAFAQLANLQADILVVAAYGIILPPSVLAVPTRGCINIHASLLPRWRGAAPVQRAIQAGDKQTGITIMQMERGLDTGPILLTQTTKISELDTGASLHDRLADLGGKTIAEALHKLDQLTPKPQDNSLATYAHRLSKAEGNIDWKLPSRQISQTLRALTPWPGCFSTFEDRTIKIHHAEWGYSEDGTQNPKIPAPGTVLSRSANGIRVACGAGWLNITRLQLPGARALEAKDFVNGNHSLLLPGHQFSHESS